MIIMMFFFVFLMLIECTREVYFAGLYLHGRAFTIAFHDETCLNVTLKKAPLGIKMLGKNVLLEGNIYHHS